MIAITQSREITTTRNRRATLTSTTLERLYSKSFLLLRIPLTEIVIESATRVAYAVPPHCAAIRRQDPGIIRVIYGVVVSVIIQPLEPCTTEITGNLATQALRRQ